MLDLPAVDGFDNRVAGRKMPVEGADPDAGPSRDLVQADVGPSAGERSLRRLEQKVAVAQRVGARLAQALLRLCLNAPAGAAGSPLGADAHNSGPLLNGGILRI